MLIDCRSLELSNIRQAYSGMKWHTTGGVLFVIVAQLKFSVCGREVRVSHFSCKIEREGSDGLGICDFFADRHYFSSQSFP